MEARQLLGEYQQALSERSKPALETRLQRLQRVEQVVKEQKAFLARQEAKARAAAQQDALEARVHPIGTSALVHG